VCPRSAKNSTKRRRISAAGRGAIRGSRSIVGLDIRRNGTERAIGADACRTPTRMRPVGCDSNRPREPVATVATLLVLVVAAIHVYILVLEMFLWRTERGRRAFGTDQAFADASAALAANQGLYNGILAAGLIWGAIAADPVGFQVKVFFLGAVAIAGIYGAATVNRRILLVQTAPALIALGAVIAAG
jgi:putative membrane protein